MTQSHPPEVFPSVAKWQLHTRLMAARRNMKKSRAEVAESLDWSVSKLLRIENGNVGVATSDLMALCEVYSLSDSERIDMIELAEPVAGRVLQVLFRMCSLVSSRHGWTSR